MNREQLVDTIEENYNSSPDSYELLDEAIRAVTSVDPETMDDSDPEEGMYANFTTSELRSILEYCQNGGANSNANYSIDHLTSAKYRFIREVMEMYTDPYFSAPSEDKTMARRILLKITG